MLIKVYIAYTDVRGAESQVLVATTSNWTHAMQRIAANASRVLVTRNAGVILLVCKL